MELISPPNKKTKTKNRNKINAKKIKPNNTKVRRKTFRSSAELLELLLSNRPSSQELALRGILKDYEKLGRKKRKIEERLEKELSNKKLEKEVELTIRDCYYHPSDDWERAKNAALELLNKRTREKVEVVKDGEEFKLVKYCDIVFHPDGRLGGGSFGDVFVAVVPGNPPPKKKRTKENKGKRIKKQEKKQQQ